MIELVGFWLGAAASFGLGWLMRSRVAKSDGGEHEFMEGYEAGVAAERAASRKRGRELAEAIEVKQQAPFSSGEGQFQNWTGYWPQ